MKRLELKDFFLTQFTNHLSHSAEQKTITITIQLEILESIDISSELYSAALYYGFQHGEHIDLLQYDVHLDIEMAFNELSFDHRYPKKLTIRDCSGKKVTVHRSLPPNFRASDLLSMSIINADISKVSIFATMHLLDTFNLMNCAKVYISNNQFNTTKTGHINIIGDVKLFDLRDVNSEKISIFLTKNDPKGNETSAVTLSRVTTEMLEVNSDETLNVYLKNSAITSVKIRSTSSIEFIKVLLCEIKKIEINFFHTGSGDITIDNVRSLKQLKILGFSEKGIHSVRSLSIIDTYLEKEFIGDLYKIKLLNGIQLEKLTNRGEFRFDDVILENEPMTIVRSVLGKTAFFNCDLTDRIKFDTSNIEEVLFYNTKSPRIVEAVGDFDSTKLYENEKSIFRQLKIASSKSGDKELSNEFRSKELFAYYQLLRWSQKNWFSENFPEKLTIWANQSNDFGQNWGRAFRLILLFSVGMYLLFLNSIGFQIEVYTPESFELLKKLWSNYFDFIIPGYLYPSKNKLAFLNDLIQNPNLDGKTVELSTLPLKTKILVYLNDILIMPYLIIQMVTAFRKHVGKE